MKKFYFEGKLIHTAENLAALETPECLEKAAQSGKILEWRASRCDREHNLILNLPCMQGIIPRDEGAMGIAEGTVRDIALISRVGKPVQFIVKKILKDKSGKLTALLSRKAVQEMCENEYAAELKCGDIIDAKVTHLERFGAFVDIGAGVNSLVPIDMLSVSRISHPSERVSLSEELKLIVHNKNDGKITLSLRELLGSWEENAEQFNAGETVEGIVRSVESYGVFIELTPNLAGLAEYTSEVSVGQCVSVYIKAVLPEKMKIKLSIIDLFGFENKPKKLKYFYKDDHIDYWRYSPENSSKIIETNFPT